VVGWLGGWVVTILICLSFITSTIIGVMMLCGVVMCRVGFIILPQVDLYNDIRKNFESNFEVNIFEDPNNGITSGVVTFGKLEDAKKAIGMNPKILSKACSISWFVLISMNVLNVTFHTGLTLPQKKKTKSYAFLSKTSQRKSA